ncbi:hypothetical protein [Longimicrobium sp.]|uniref:hypothetical protein n=1 Tax=Longimicrobium sp. TaxID=2029185 RepID=UPI002E33CA90|nr:hypothetical protein [Longimicrobium sp.]HEX6036829.1 hypothetical protein [Longimicrobium sp.]
MSEMAPVPGHPRHTIPVYSPDLRAGDAGPCLDIDDAPVFVTGRLPREPSPRDGLPCLPDATTTEEDAEW